MFSFLADKELAKYLDDVFKNKIAKDALDSITAAGYNVTMEEVDGLTDYQIIIKVEK